MSDIDWNSLEFVEAADVAQFNLEDTLSALSSVIEKATSSATADLASILKSAGEDVDHYARELLDKVEQVPTAAVRCDIFVAVERLLELAFDIGRRATEANSLKNERSKIQSERAKAGVEIKKKKALEWQSKCNEIIAAKIGDDKRISKDDLIDFIMEKGVAKSAGIKRSTIDTYVTRRLGRPPGRPKGSSTRLQKT